MMTKTKRDGGKQLGREWFGGEATQAGSEETKRENTWGTT